jgi:hypothetical protein
MKPKISLCVPYIAVVMQFGLLAGSAQTNQYLFTGSQTNITLNPGRYYITAYGARGGHYGPYGGGLGVEMKGEFSFTTRTTLTLLVGGAGATYAYAGAGGGGGGSFVINGTTPLVVAGGGGGAGCNAGGRAGNIDTNGSSGLGTAGITGMYHGGSGGSGGYGGGGGGYYAGGGGGGGFFAGGDVGEGNYGGGGGSSFVGGGGGGSGGNSGGYGGGGGGAAGNGPGGGGGGGYSGGGGGADYYGGKNGGGGGGSIIDASAIAVLAEVSGVASPDGSPHGEIIITAIPVTLNYQVVDGKLVLNWAQGTLLSAGTAEGTYTPVNGASSPYTNSMTGAQRYFRVMVQ